MALAGALEINRSVRSMDHTHNKIVKPLVPEDFKKSRSLQTVNLIWRATVLAFQDGALSVPGSIYTLGPPLFNMDRKAWLEEEECKARLLDWLKFIYSVMHAKRLDWDKLVTYCTPHLPQALEKRIMEQISLSLNWESRDQRGLLESQRGSLYVPSDTDAVQNIKATIDREIFGSDMPIMEKKLHMVLDLTNSAVCTTTSRFLLDNPLMRVGKQLKERLDTKRYSVHFLCKVCGECKTTKLASPDALKGYELDVAWRCCRRSTPLCAYCSWSSGWLAFR
eukprot:gene23381-28373_t